MTQSGGAFYPCDVKDGHNWSSNYLEDWNFFPGPRERTKFCLSQFRVSDFLAFLPTSHGDMEYQGG